jgi:hypothetical protein
MMMRERHHHDPPLDPSRGHDFIAYKIFKAIVKVYIIDKTCLTVSAARRSDTDHCLCSMLDYE